MRQPLFLSVAGGTTQGSPGLERDPYRHPLSSHVPEPAPTSAQSHRRTPRACYLLLSLYLLWLSLGCISAEFLLAAKPYIVVPLSRPPCCFLLVLGNPLERD